MLPLARHKQRWRFDSGRISRHGEHAGVAVCSDEAAEGELLKGLSIAIDVSVGNPERAALSRAPDEVLSSGAIRYPRILISKG